MNDYMNDYLDESQQEPMEEAPAWRANEQAVHLVLILIAIFLVILCGR